MKHDVFISYHCESNSVLAYILYERLTKQDILYFNILSLCIQEILIILYAERLDDTMILF